MYLFNFLDGIRRNSWNSGDARQRASGQIFHAVVDSHRLPFTVLGSLRFLTLADTNTAKKESDKTFRLILSENLRKEILRYAF